MTTPPFFDDLRAAPRFQNIIREVEARHEKLREEVRQLGLDLYPPGAEPVTASSGGYGRMPKERRD